MVEKRYESDLTRKEKRELEWKKIKGMSWKDRIGHIWAYYKPHMAVGIGIIAVLCLIGQMIYRSQFDTVFYAAILNGGMGDSAAMAEDFKEYIGDDDKYHEITIDSSMYFSGNDNEDYTSVMKLSTLIGAREVDAFIATKEEFDSYGKMDAFVPMDELLTQEQLEAYGDDVSEYGIHVESSSKLEEFGMTPGEDAYLAVFTYSENIDNAKSFIKYICEGGKS